MQTNTTPSLYGTHMEHMAVNTVATLYGTHTERMVASTVHTALSMPTPNTPPVIVDNSGNFYGYFTVNQYKSQRADFGLVNMIYKFYDLMREDISAWYEKLF